MRRIPTRAAVPPPWLAPHRANHPPDGRCSVVLLRSVCLAALLWPLAGVLSAAEPGKDADAQRIARLIEQLGSTQFTEREAATQELARLGPTALDGLRQAAEAD